VTDQTEADSGLADGYDPFVLDEEQALLRDAQAGDRRAFTVLVDRYWDRLYRWLYHLTHDVHVAEDLAQESFLKAFARIETFRVGSNFKAWLFRIGHNNFVNLRRGRAAQAVRQPLPDVAASSEGPEEEALSREAILHLTRAVGRLPAEFRAAFLLRAEEGLSFKQVAEILGITEQTARWRVFKARQKLLKVLAPELLTAAEASSPPPTARPDTDRRS
jgi:RNA polymerase sigma-70 factor (ECF subfamily)